MPTPSRIRNHIPAAQLAAGPMVITAGDILTMADVAALDALGVGLDARFIAASTTYDATLDGSGFDANTLQPLVGTANLGAPIQFLQNWLPGIVRVITTARKIDQLTGVTIGGAWEDEEVVQTVLEPTGFASLYGDYTNVPLSSWNQTYETRTIVRWENGMRVGRLEDARASRVNISSAAEKRASAALSLEIMRNRVGFYGFNGGADRTYGFLNDPGLPNYVSVASGGSGTTWASKTFLEIIADIRTAAAALQTRSGDNIDPTTTPTILAVALAANQFLAVTSEFGISVKAWLAETYPQMTIVTVPELNGANGGANVFYLYAVRVEDGSSDDGIVFAQIVPAKFQSLGTEQRAKEYLEDYTNALGGIMVKRPWAVVRYTGI